MKPATITKKRHNKRTSILLSVVVKGKEDTDTFWNETTELINMSRSGAGFYLERTCNVGRLVSLIVAMPHHRANRRDAAGVLHRALTP